MTKLFQSVYNVTTGEITQIDLTEQEIVEREQQAKAENDLRAERELATQTALAKLAAIGLTPEDLTALGF